jgi:amino acid adenylation domain-containing protein
VYLPLDPVYPVGRVAQVLADAGPAVLVTVGAWASVGVPAGTTVVTVDAWPEGREDDPAVGVGVDDAAYVIYTSGSTGTPKGVIVEHRSLANLVGWHNRVYGVDREARGSQIASVGFDAAVWEIWPYLCAGASVWVVDDDTRNDVDGLIAWLADREITTAFIPTPLAEMVLDRPWPAHARLSHLLTGGDTLHRWANPDHPYTLVNHYGPTEHTVVATATVVPAVAHPDRLPTIGAPIDNTVCYVVDHTGHQAGPGVPGELWIGGVGCARGYLDDSDLTAQRFVPNPFAATPPRLYRTGDHVRWTADGTLAFLGRLDHQIKIRGYRIEPRELETLLTRHPHITNAIITTHPHPTTNTTQLTAYITTTDTIAPDQVKTWLKGRLPAPMMPAAVVVIDAVPVTPNGKIDVDALPVPAFGVADGFVPSHNATEELLCRLWAETLTVPHVGVTDDFFEHGGHSLVATQLVSRIRDALHVELPLRTLFEVPTPAGIAEVLRTDPAAAARIDRAAEVVLRVMDLSTEDLARLTEQHPDVDS